MAILHSPTMIAGLCVCDAGKSCGAAWAVGCAPVPEVSKNSDELRCGPRGMGSMVRDRIAATGSVVGSDRQFGVAFVR